MNDDVIGGYFGLELDQQRKFLYREANLYQSARAAFLALLRVAQPSRVWMPNYICNAMLQPIKQAGIACQFYSLDQRYDIISPPKLDDNEILVYVNYFGVGTENVDRILAFFNPKQVVLDCSQAFFSPVRDCLATIYSPRKFFGVPDGGILVTKLNVEKPEMVDMDSVLRTEHLLTRLADTPQAGYAAYKRAENSLNDCEPRLMSPLTQRILQSIDFEYVRIKRNQNFKFLHGELANRNLFSFYENAIDGPLCYPLWTTKGELRLRLIDAKVFVPTYWIDLLDRVSRFSQEAKFSQCVIPLPCDQRYGSNEMTRIIEICTSC